MISLFSISIIVSTYSKSRLSNLCDCIESIKQQTIPVEEIILVLDHNKDLLTFFKSKFKDSVKVISSGGLGLSKARNVGVQLREETTLHVWEKAMKELYGLIKQEEQEKQEG